MKWKRKMVSEIYTRKREKEIQEREREMRIYVYMYNMRQRERQIRTDLKLKKEIYPKGLPQQGTVHLQTDSEQLMGVCILPLFPPRPTLYYGQMHVLRPDDLMR